MKKPPASPAPATETAAASTGRAIQQFKNETWPVSKFVPYEKNPRRHSAEVIEKMINSIMAFGFTVPMLARSEGALLIDGHLRLKAVKKMGMKEVPVILCDGWTDDQVKAFRIQVNRSATWAEWDEKLLASAFLDLNASEFKLELTGFEMDEVSSTVSSIFEPKKPKAKKKKAAPAVSDAVQKFEVLVDCISEEHQTKALELLNEQGYNCRAVSPIAA
jgi:ParB-like chromosome segregation protein Spo0J